MAYEVKQPGTMKFYACTDDDGNYVATADSTSSVLFTFGYFNATYAKDPETNATAIGYLVSEVLQKVLVIYPATDYRRWSSEVEYTTE